MPADFLHFVRHGEVANPEGILYGRREGFGLSPRGHEMAKRSADALATRPITKILSSPLQRAVESATPLATQLKLEIEIDERLLEGLNDFEGTTYGEIEKVHQNHIHEHQEDHHHEKDHLLRFHLRDHHHHHHYFLLLRS